MHPSSRMGRIGDQLARLADDSEVTLWSAPNKDGVVALSTKIGETPIEERFTVENLRQLKSNRKIRSRVEHRLKFALDETTVLRFRHLLEKHALRGAMLDAVNLHLAAKGIRIETGTIVDATIIHAPSSTKNEKKERDPAMCQTRKGKQWYFGLKAHIGVDAKEGHVHSVATSAANVSDVPMLPDLLHGEERKVWGDGGYQGQTKAIQQAAPQSPGHDLQANQVQELCR